MDNYPPPLFCFMVSRNYITMLQSAQVQQLSHAAVLAVSRHWPRLQQSWSGATGRIKPWNHHFLQHFRRHPNIAQFPEVYVCTVIMNFLIVQKYHACMVLLLYYYVLTILFPLNMAAPWFPSLCVLFVQSHCSQKFGVCNLLHLGWLPQLLYIDNLH